MNNGQIIIGSTIVIIFVGIFLFLNFNSNQNKWGSLLPPTPTIDMTAPFQLISPAQPQAQQNIQGAQTQQQVQQPPPPTAAPTSAASSFEGPLPATVSATIHTAKGDIVLSLFADKAPKTVGNFIAKAQAGFYNNLTFHRVEDWVVQGGDPKGDGTGGGQMPAEQTPGINFVTGSLGIARGSDPTINNAAQFFITKKQADWLNGQYTNFGIVTSGMDVVNKLAVGDKIQTISVDLTQTEGGGYTSP